MIKAREITSPEQWLDWRSQYIGASEIAAVFEAHPYKSKSELWGEKVGIIGRGKETAPMKWGKLLESVVAQVVGIERPDWRLIKADRYYSDDQTHIGASPDFMIFDDPRGVGVLQCKIATRDSFEKQWQDEGPPFWIALQCATEIMMTDAAFGVIAVLLFDPWRDPAIRIFDVPRDRDAENKAIVGVREFWEKHVVAAKPPEPNPDRDRRLLPKLIPREAPGMEIDLTRDNELPGLLDLRVAAKATIADLQTQCESIETIIMARMGTNERANLPNGWRATWRVEPRKAYTVAASSPRVLRLLKPKKGFA